MKLIPTYSPFLLCLMPLGITAQISPGALSSAHAHLEGISNCTQCHDIGNKVPDHKCLACHDEIQSLIRLERGYHASSEVKSASCIDCHSEHHGRNFDMMRFDEQNFNHDKAGYALQGQHKVIDCRDCHKAEFIDDPEIRRRKNTFLGLDQECLSCHNDFHQGTLSEDCRSCHDFDAFRPASGFDHNDTEFPLTGMHVDVECISCHEKTMRKGVEFQVFSEIAHNDCKACHEDPHNGQFNAKCSQCHTTEGFEQFAGRQNFDHNTTGFPLKGKHRQVDCFSCHMRTKNIQFIFQDKAGIGIDECIACHDDIHEGRFGDDCAKCHNEQSFLTLNSMDFFDHDLTDYPLEGKHLQVDCKECHTERYTEPIDFSACQNCHEDYHQGEFAEPPPAPDCAKCHTVRGFEFSLFGPVEHQETAFPLEGAHLATPCFACHLEEERWTFRDIGLQCIDCHDDIHEGYISSSYYPEQNCGQCHISESWDTINFEHEETGWALEGEHAKINCRDCHFQEGEEAGVYVYVQVFSQLETSCTECHVNIHGDQFIVNGITDCTRCHVSSSWSPELFDHDQTEFPLDGKHAEIECRECHKVKIENDEEIIQYKMESFECIDCHS